MITMEQIDEYRKRTNSSYEDAKYYLERNNRDVLDAIIDFERSKTGRSGHRERHHGQSFQKAGISRTMVISFQIYCKKGLIPGFL